MSEKGSNHIHIADRLEPFVDDYLLESLSGCELRLHPPQPQEVAIAHTEPWEGNTCFYHTVFRDGDIVRMYYRASHVDESRPRETLHQVTCYAESRDGIHWEKPELGLCEWRGSKKNNIIISEAEGSHEFVPFRDDSPDCAPEERYKALAAHGSRARGTLGLYYFTSPDGIRWKLKTPKPVITKGAFDSQNLAFWDGVRGLYVDYHRDFRDGVRDIVTCTSSDFLSWTEPRWLSYPGAPAEHLYTNQIIPYYRAPHVYLGFPKRFAPGRDVVPGYSEAGVSDAVFMSSRDGESFRRWREAYIRPGLQESRWVNRNNFIAWGLIETDSKLSGAPPEISLYSAEAYYRGDGTRMRRYTTRVDGFVSLNAPMSGAEVLTKPFVFDGENLSLNVSTSAPGSIEIEVLDAGSKRISGYSYEDFGIIFGDSTEMKVQPKSRSFGELAGTPIRLRMRLKDADLYAIRFT